MAVVSNGTTIIDAGALGSGVATGKMTLIKTLTASGSGTLSFVDGAASVVLDATYDSYVFKFINIHPATDGAFFTFQANAAGASGFNETITSTNFRAFNKEDDSETELGYVAGSDQAQGTAFQRLTQEIDNDNDSCSGGTLHLFNPSSTTFVKHFLSKTNSMHTDPQSVQVHSAGYINTTAAIDEIQFKMSSGNIDSGVIKLYGIGG